MVEFAIQHTSSSWKFSSTVVYYPYTNIGRCKQKHNDDFKGTNEHASLYRYTSHTLFSKGLRKGWCWLCVTERDCHILTPSSSDHSSTSSKFCWAAQSWVLRFPTPLSGAGSHSAGILSPTATGTRTPAAWNWLKPSVVPVLTSTCFPLAYASAPNSTTSTGQGDIPISSTGFTCFRCSSAYLHRFIS